MALTDSDVFETLRQKLKLKSFETKSNLHSKHPHVKKILSDKGVDLSTIRTHSAKILGAGIASGVLLLSPMSSDGSHLLNNTVKKISQVAHDASKVPVRSTYNTYMEKLNEILPDQTRALSREEEKKLEKLFEETYGVKAKATLEGEHLNQTFGKIGAEQHLRRYPGDTISNHGSLADQKEGMAPGLGAWGYFADSKEHLTPDLVETEKWYAVVQTLYLPDWNTRTRFLRDWYKYRKVLIVNTQNGKAVVAAIADSGPAAWTGKHYGGSPEVMEYLGGPKYKKGPVVLFFVDDPNNKVPLGPVTMQDTQQPTVTLKEI